MRTILFLMGVLACTCTSAVSQPCTPQFLPGEGVAGANSGIFAACVFDFDGDGPEPPQLVIGGNFTAVGSTVAQTLARWDGTTWRPMVTGPRNITALLSFDPDGDGPLPPQLIVAGSYDAPGTPLGVVSAVARWNGAQWDRLGTELEPGYALVPYALASFDPDGAGPLPPRLIVGGNSLNSASGSLHCIAQWDGQHWTALGTGFADPNNPYVSSLTVYDPDGAGPAPAQLIAAGTFTSAGSVTVNSIASWDGSSWHALASGVSGNGFVGEALALTTFDPDGGGPLPPEIIVSGVFDSAGGIPVRGIAAWNGSNWHNLAQGLVSPGGSGYATGLTTYSAPGGPTELIAIGQFTSAGGTPVNNIAAWNGSAWHGLGAGVHGISGLYKDALITFDPDGQGPSLPFMIVASSLIDAGGVGVANIAAWNGSDWLAIGNGFDKGIRALARYRAPGASAPEVIAGGDFGHAGSSACSRIARFDGTTWQPLGGGVSGYSAVVNAMTTIDRGTGEELVVGGQFSAAGGTPVSNIATWDGAAWHALGSLYGPITAVTTFDFDGPGPEPAQIVAANGFSVWRWDGTQWVQLGGYLGINVLHDSPNVYSLAVLDPDGPGPEPRQLFVAGYFSSINGVSMGGLARWNGQAWEGMDLPGRLCSAVVTYDADESGPAPTRLIAAGTFFMPSQMGVASWDGSSWTPLNATQGISGLCVFDPDGPGLRAPMLIATTFGHLLSWSGYSWSLYGPSLDKPVQAMMVVPGDPPRLLVGGSFSVNSVSNVSASFAQLACLPYPCYANCDQSTSSPTLDINDFQCFLNQFAAGYSYANCDGSVAPPVLNVNDFQCFLNAFAAGCP